MLFLLILFLPFRHREGYSCCCWLAVRPDDGISTVYVAANTWLHRPYTQSRSWATTAVPTASPTRFIGVLSPHSFHRLSSRLRRRPLFHHLQRAWRCSRAPAAAPDTPATAPKAASTVRSRSASHKLPQMPAHLAAILQRSRRVPLIRLRKPAPPSHAAPWACLHALGSVPTAASSWRTRAPPPSHAKP